MKVSSRMETSGGITEVELVVSVKEANYGAMNKAVFDTAGRTLRQVFEQVLLNELEKAHDTLKSVQAL